MEIKCEYTKLIELHKLQPNPKNPNKHPKEQIDRLAQIINYQGMRSPIVVSKRSGFITKGHGRLEALKNLKWETAPVDYQEYEDEAQEYADMVADNAIAEWAAQDLSIINKDLIDFGPELKIDMLGIKDFVLEPIEKYDEETQDDVPDVMHDPITKRGDVWLLGEHRVMCGDSTMIDDVEKLMNDQKADFGFCDPPYNLGHEYNSYEDNKSHHDYIEFSKSWFNNLQQISHRQAVTLGTKNITIMANLHSVAGAGCWVKKNWITSCHIAKLQQWEPIFFYGDYTKHKRNSDLYEINRTYQKDVGSDHTCPKQIKLIEDIIMHYSDNHTVDLFLGSGTTLIACEKTNRKCYGMELDEHYCDVIVERWQKYTDKEATLESTGQKYGTA